MLWPPTLAGHARAAEDAAIGCPVSESPMRRLKNRSASPLAAPWLPTVNCPEFSRKKSRFSGKNSGKRREVHLLLVHFRLREIGVDGDVEREARP